MEDITKTGRQSNKVITNQINSNFDVEALMKERDEYNALRQSGRAAAHQAASSWEDEPVRSNLFLQGNGDYFGDSIWDRDRVTSEEFEHLGDIRAQEQSWIAQLGAGLGKGVGLAATTFLDGTVGLLYGIGQGIAEGRVSALWDNDVSNALQEVNQEMEKILPNYRTEEEQNRPWYQNLGTMNFWADGVFKNLGFTVGAFYSGGVWTKGLKVAGLMKKATSAQVVGSVLSGFNEGRIEANNGQRDFLELENQKIQDTRDALAMDIAARGDLSDSQKIQALQELDTNMETMRQDALERAHTMGLTTLIGNTILLSIDNLWQFGKLYGRGFNNAKGLANRIERGAAREGVEDVVENGAKRYVAKTTNRGMKVARGLSNGLVEGNEEMAQAFIADYAGNMQSYDSPDAYYEALTDPNAQLKTKDFLTSATEGFANTYGNGDRWEEFAIGAFTGLLGMPTFGKVQNSDANTWLGRGKAVGISGGVFGEIKSATQREREAKEAVDVMNKYMDKLQTQAGYFAQSQSFTDAMDGFAVANNNFEYKNASNNDDFAAISRFARTGRLDDLKEIVKQDFEGMSDEQLADIARNTTPNIVMGDDGTIATTDDNNETMTGGWRNADGSLMSDTEEGRATMRAELSKKRDKILKEIDEYEKSVETVRAIGNNSLTEDQVNELAWLNWKVKIFDDRYKSLKEENTDNLRELKSTVSDYVQSIEGAEQDALSEDHQKVHDHMKILDEYLSMLLNSKNALELGRVVAKNPKIQEALEDPFIEALTGLNHEEFTKTMTDLQDMAKIGKAANQFNDRYKDFSENPINLIKNRQRIDKVKKKVSDAIHHEKRKNETRQTSVADMVHADEIGDMSLDEIEQQFADDADVQAKVQAAQNIKRDSQQMESILDDDGTIDPQALNDAKKLLDNSKSKASDEQELLDLEREAFNDPSILYDEDDPTLQGLPSQAEIQETLNMRLDNAKTVLANAKAQLLHNHSSADEVQAAPIRKVAPEPAPAAETGHDAIDKVTPLNEQKPIAEAQNPLLAERDKLLSAIEQTAPIPEDVRDTFESNLLSMMEQANKLKDAGANMQQTYDVVSKSPMAKVLSQLNSNVGPLFIQYMEDLFAGEQQEQSAPVAQEDDDYTPSPELANEELIQQERSFDYDAQGRAFDINKVERPEGYAYWKPTITQLPIHRRKGSKRFFHDVAANDDRYTPAQRQKIYAVGQYLLNNGAFDRVNNGGVQVGDEVHFKIDNALNTAAGEIVILMTDKDGNVIGDVMSATDGGSMDKQIGLRAFIDRVMKEYQTAGSPDNFTSKESTTVDKIMVGKVLFQSDDQPRHTLNEVHTNPNGSPINFKLGLAMSSGPQAKMIGTPGRTKAQGQSEFDKSIIPALSAKEGQPFLLMPTADKKGRRQYIPVPFMMPKFGGISADSTLFKFVEETVARIQTGDNTTAPQIISDLKELLALKELHINYSGDNVKVHIKTGNMAHQVQIYNGPKTANNLISSIIQGLQSSSVPIQVSRKYINSNYKGKDYNRMIGELATINLAVGDTHTVSDWFTLKPLDAAGKQMKARSPKTTGINPNAAQTTQLMDVGNGWQVNLKANEVWYNGKLFEGPEKSRVLAHAFGIQSNQDMSQPYMTEWGYYNPTTQTFENPEVKRTLGAELIPIKSLHKSEDIKDIKIDSTITGLGATSLSKGIRIKPNITKEDVLAQLKGEADNMYAEQKKAVLQKLEAEGWTIDKIESLIDSNEAATSMIIEHERSHFNALNTDENAERYNVKEAHTEDGNGFMDEKAISVETRATLDALKAVEALKGTSQETQTVPSNTSSRPTEETQTEETPTEKATKQGLLNDPVVKALWEQLTPEIQTQIANKKGPKQKQWINALKLNYDANNKETPFKRPVEEILGEKHREIEGIEVPFNMEKELQWLSRVLPQFSNPERVQLVENLTSMNGNTRLYGSFKDGVIYLNQTVQTRGTTYHEAFHAVLNTLMSEDEVRDVFAMARDKWGNLSEIALEEKLAEDFRQYTEYEQYTGTGLRGTFNKIWRKLSRMVKHLFGKDSQLNKLYYDINKGRYSAKEVKDFQGERTSMADDDPRVFKEIRKVWKAVNNLGSIEIGTTRIERPITKESLRNFFVINRAAQINRTDEENYDSKYYNADKVLKIVKDRIEQLGLTDRIDFIPYGVTYRVILKGDAPIEIAQTTQRDIPLDNSEDSYMEIEDYYQDFDRLDPEEQMNLMNYGLTKEDWEQELSPDEHYREVTKHCFGR